MDSNAASQPPSPSSLLLPPSSPQGEKDRDSDDGKKSEGLKKDENGTKYEDDGADKMQSVSGVRKKGDKHSEEEEKERDDDVDGGEDKKISLSQEEKRNLSNEHGRETTISEKTSAEVEKGVGILRRERRLQEEKATAEKERKTMTPVGKEKYDDKEREGEIGKIQNTRTNNLGISTAAKQQQENDKTPQTREKEKSQTPLETKATAPTQEPENTKQQDGEERKERQQMEN